MKTKINEGLPAMVPTFPVNVAGHDLTLRFDTNVNKTKKGVKLQFVLKGDAPQDPRKMQELANKIGSELQRKFGDANLQIIYDIENPYKNVIGFLLPLNSIADTIMKQVFKDGGESDSTEELPAEELPADEEPAAEEEPQVEPEEELPSKPLAEIKRPKLTDLFGYT